MALPNSNGSPLSYGILVWGDSAESTTNITISGNTISNVNGSGISLGDYSSDIEITNNSISDINEPIFLKLHLALGFNQVFQPMLM